VENNNSPLNIGFVTKTSDIKNFQNIRSGNTDHHSTIVISPYYYIESELAFCLW